MEKGNARCVDFVSWWEPVCGIGNAHIHHTTERDDNALELTALGLSVAESMHTCAWTKTYMTDWCDVSAATTN